MVKYAIIALEGNHDQALVGKLLKVLGFKSEEVISWLKLTN